MKIDIMEAEVKDLAEILVLQKVCFQSEAELYNDYDITPLTQDLASITEEFSKGIFLKAVSIERESVDGKSLTRDVKGKILASVRAAIQEPHTGSLPEEKAMISRLVVHPEAQNQGLGRRLMGQIEKELQTAHPKLKYFELFTGGKSEKNISLYQKLGYKIYKTEKLGPIDFVFMHKPLRGALGL